MNDESQHIIKNFEALATTPARSSLLAIAEAGYQAIRTQKVVRDAVTLENETLTVGGKDYLLSEYQNVYVIGVGKCAVDSALELESILGDRITEGLVIDVDSSDELRTVEGRVGTHPYPSADNVQHTKALLSIAEKATQHDLVIMIVSGGGSTLLCRPESHTFSDEVQLVEHLFKAGATIEELNTIRKHLSKARGGHIAQAVHPAELIALIFSDVPGDDIRTISSGPTVLDESTLDDATEVFEKYTAERCGFSVRHLFETPKDENIFARVHNVLILKNTTALEAMKETAEALGYTAMIKETKLQGEARIVGEELVHELRREKARTVHLYGGETTVTISGPGKGGRNQELALSAVPLIEDDELIVSLASDGHDNTEYAGGIADKYTRGKAEDAGLVPGDYLFTNDSFSFFHTLQQGIETGYTGANVADLVIAIKHER
jgi:glycerate-2-kinase